ncbi:MAG TPA: stage V sporulation protein AA [Candidatus Cottocaccamicrobium excrementipullorum]|nr:stage V sporulation protein AA [Candidatus Cottocaccamicrobium excrementipullorum]
MNKEENSTQVYLKVNSITQVHHKEILLKDVASLFCSDQKILERCQSLPIFKVKDNKEKRYVQDVMPIIQKITQLGQGIQVVNLGETDFILDYRPLAPPKLFWQWMKTIFVCIVCFFGAAFAIMTFNNDVDVPALFSDLYQLVTGKESSGFTILEASYSFGLSAGIIVFFNHFAKWKLNADPTPLEVEMRTYEEDISRTLIENAGRKETEVDVH